MVPDDIIDSLWDDDTFDSWSSEVSEYKLCLSGEEDVLMAAELRGPRVV